MMAAPTPLRHTWTDWRGRQFALTRDTGMWLGPGFRGVDAPAVTVNSQDGFGHGDRFTGWRAPNRDVFWPLHISPPPGSPGSGWPALAGPLLQSMHPDRPGVWTVSNDRGLTRTLTCRWIEEDTTPTGHVIGMQVFGHRFQGAPFWEGDPVERAWGVTGYTGPWLLPEGDPTTGVIRLGTSSAAGTVRVNNPGDVEAWPTWTIRGPATGWSVGVGSQLITSATTLVDGDTRTITTDGGGVYVVDGNGADRFTELTAARAVPIPSGGTVTITASITGAGSVAVTFRPRYFRGWGW